MTVRTSTNGRKYTVFRGPEGTRQMQSLPAAWAEHDRLIGAESDTESVPSRGQESREGSGEESEPGIESVEVGTPVVTPALEFFEITPGGCGTKECIFRHGHDGQCSSVVVLPRRRRGHAAQHLDEVAARASPSRLGESL